MVNDVAVDVIYFAQRFWRALTVYSRYPRQFASYYVFNSKPRFIAILVPAWNEAAVIASMLKSTLKRIDYDNYRIFVGYYRNDPAIAAAVASVAALALFATYGPAAAQTHSGGASVGIGGGHAP